MKTAIIFNEIEDIKYFVVDGDFSKLNGDSINSVEYGDSIQEELLSVIFDEDLAIKLEDLTLMEFSYSIKKGAVLIECGFLL